MWACPRFRAFPLSKGTGSSVLWVGTWIHGISLAKLFSLPNHCLSLGDLSPGCWWGLAPAPLHWFSVTSADFSPFHWNLSTSQLTPVHGSWAGRQSLGSCREGGNVLSLFPLFPPRCDRWALAASLPAGSTGTTWNCCIFPVPAFPDPVSLCGCDSRAEGSRCERQESAPWGFVQATGADSFFLFLLLLLPRGICCFPCKERDAAQEILSLALCSMRMKRCRLAAMDGDFGKNRMSLQEAAPVLSGAGAHILGLEAFAFQNLLIHLPECQSSGLQALMELLFLLL